MTRRQVPDLNLIKMKTFALIPAWRLPLTLFSGLLVAGSLATNAEATPGFITGSIQFSGGATLDTGDLATATAFTSIFGPGGPGTMPVVLGGGTSTGDYSTVPDGTLVSFQTFGFAVSAPVVPLWSFTVGATSYSFDASSETIVYQDGNFLDIQGNGIAHITGFSDTAGTWEVTDTGVGNVPVFTFGAATDVLGNPAPEPATVALLALFLPVVWMTLRARRNTQNPLPNKPAK
jgi:hypothetical protein